MVVQTHFPQKLSAKRYDQFLASGWFRGSVMLYKMDLLCLEDDLYSVINIRLKIEKHELKRSLKKIERKGKDRFKVEIAPVKLTRDKEDLYAIQKKKFQGFIHKSLHDFLYSGFRNTVFDTYEVCVYDDEKLVASSYFDLGEKSLASLLCIYDPEYSSYSLGIFTMLIELEFAKNNGFKWYYPGYILNEDRGFDYKLRLGDFEYYNSNKRWSHYSHFNPKEVLSYQVNQRNKNLEHELTKNGIRYKKWLYPYFGIGYMNMWDVSFLKLPVLMELSRNNNGMILFIAYDLDSKEYQLFWGEHATGHEHMVNMTLSDNMKNNKHFLLNLYRYVDIVYQSDDLSELIDYTVNQGEE